jgi:hypothetical protein
MEPFQFGDVVSVVRPPAGEYFVQNKPERKNVAAHRDLAILKLFGSHVSRCPGAVAASGEFISQAREAEVGDAYATPAVDHDVRGFEVAMQHAVFVGGCETEAKLTGDLNGLLFTRATHARQNVGQILAVDVLHRKEYVPIDLADVIHPAHVGVGNLPGVAYFATKTVHGGRVASDFFGQKLQRDRLTQFQVIRAIDLAHAAASE